MLPKRKNSSFHFYIHYNTELHHIYISSIYTYSQRVVHMNINSYRYMKTFPFIREYKINNKKLMNLFIQKRMHN